LVERYYRPTVLIAIDPATEVGRASGRSIAGFNLFEAFRGCADLLEGYGGHQMAAGLSIRASQVASFAERFDSIARSQLLAEQLTPESRVDDELDFASIDATLLEELDRLEPFGAGNPEPLFLARDVVVQSKRLVGEQHLRVYLRQARRALPAIGFGMADRGLEEGGHYDILFVPEANEWDGGRVLQLRLRDVRTYRPADT
jgi:single-stranded-DNA-specific exonuclease